MKIRIDAVGISYSSTLFVFGIEKKLVVKDGVVDTNDTVLAEHLLKTQVGSEVIPEPVAAPVSEPAVETEIEKPKSKKDKKIK